MPLSKKDKEILRSLKCDIDKPTAPPLHYVVKMSLTQGELIALKNALDAYDSLVGRDVRAYVNNAITREGIEV